ncbi:tetratricopeptide repeat protein, partial [bacterium]|nr:tetratricopeptide repeat protein [bacterium]
MKELYNSGEKEKAFLTTVDKLREEKSPVERSSLASFASKMLFEAGKFEKALEYALEARNQARLADDYIAFCKAAISIGRIHFRQGRLREAEQAWHEALSLVVIFGNRKLHGRILLNLSILDQRRGNHVRALDILEKARLMLQEENDL